MTDTPAPPAGPDPFWKGWSYAEGLAALGANSHAAAWIEAQYDNYEADCRARHIIATTWEHFFVDSLGQLLADGVVGAEHLNFPAVRVAAIESTGTTLDYREAIAAVGGQDSATLRRIEGDYERITELRACGYDLPQPQWEDFFTARLEMLRDAGGLQGPAAYLNRPLLTDEELAAASTSGQPGQDCVIVNRPPADDGLHVDLIPGEATDLMPAWAPGPGTDRPDLFSHDVPRVDRYLSGYTPSWDALTDEDYL